MVKLFNTALKHHKSELLGVLLLGAFSSLAIFTISLTSGYLFSHSYDYDKNKLIPLFGAFFIVISSCTILTFLSEIHFKSVNVKIIAFIMPLLWEHILSLPLFNLKHASQLSKLLTDFESAITTIVKNSFSVFCDIFLLSLLLFYLCYNNLFIASIYLTTYSTLLLIRLYLHPTIKQLSENQFTAQTKSDLYLYEVIAQIHKIKTSNTEKIAHKSWLHLLLVSKRFSILIAKFETLIWLTENICFLSLVLLSLHTQMSVPFLICASQIALVYERFSSNLIGLYHAIIMTKRLSPLLQIESKPLKLLCHADHLFLQPYNGDLRLLNVTHRKLKNVSMHIPAGSFTALIGETGEGKSTIFKLILGLEPLQQGQILFDNHNINDIDMTILRKNFGVVLQTSNLFPGTIFSNISANTNITLDEAWNLSRLVALDEEVNAMPMKMFTYLSDNAGDSISGGQRQKILLARALATKPNILFLDEATSALDNESESIIFNNLKSLNITRIIITHRHNTITNADHIYQIISGRVIMVK